MYVFYDDCGAFGEVCLIYLQEVYISVQLYWPQGVSLNCL